MAVIFAITIVIEAKAQEKYEYSTVIYWMKNLKTGVVAVSREGNFSETDVSISGNAIIENISPMLETINKMSSEGWEVYSNSTVAQNNGSHTYYYLRKKKN